MFTKREVRCTECGALNRVPRYSLRQTPKCGKCPARLPEHGSIKAARKLYRFRWWLIFAAFAGVLAWISRDQISETLNPAPACTIHALPRQGVFRWYVDSQDVADFTIKTASGSDYFVKLEDVSTGAPIRSFFVRGGSTVTNQVPFGTFTLKYASGKGWCNETDLFAADTATSQADETFTFDQQPGYTPTSWTVELIRQPGGNLRTHAIPRSQF